MMHLDVVDADKPRHVVHAQGRKLGVTAPCDPFDWRHSHRAAPRSTARRSTNRTPRSPARPRERLDHVGVPIDATWYAPAYACLADPTDARMWDLVENMGA